MTSRRRRAIAFFIDHTIVTTLWALIDNLVLLRIPDGLMALGPAVLFCLYFRLTEGVADRRASLGKQIAKLEVVLKGGGRPPSVVILQRSAVLAMDRV